MWLDGTFILEGVTYWWQAKVFDHPSHWGIDDGRVSKLVICLGDHWNFSDETWLYNYDRKLDFNHTTQDVIDAAIKCAVDADDAFLVKEASGG